MKHNLLLFITIFSFYAVNSQSLQLIDSAEIIDADIITCDQKGNIFLTDLHGNIYQYSRDLVPKLSYSPSKPFRITQLDTWQGLRIFCYYRDIQEFTLLDRFLSATENYQFELPANTFVSLATLSFDNNLWLIDQPSMTLLKYNINERRIEFDIPLINLIQKPINNILLFKEYQNKILIVDEVNGLLVFDNMGNFLLSRELEVNQEVGLFEDYIYYNSEHQIIFRNLYNDEEINIDIPINRKPTKLIRSKDDIYILEGKELYRYRIK